ncbi:MAG: 2-oxoacid:acceptor oxidoreductase family protein [Candidatus Verstraetearchaeota archaeon]|nr:2-oxoacid:acceptor oxidoreductase family protein [Candidatus Verstraetearchaeota archaeon]RLE52807.1 MAG: 2-oxoacid:ferredoxin oxidoreductase subunit gamma [Candidatus Verstraetearchaeota archaeon]
MRIEIRICGLGGQGIILAGEILGLAAVLDGKYAVQMRSYGSEARGSTCKSDVIISDKIIRYPIIENCDILVSMSQPSLNKYIDSLKPSGILIIDEDLVKNIPRKRIEKIYGLKATRIAEEKYRRIMANMIMLGYMTGKTGIVSIEKLREAIKRRRVKMAEINIKALEEGVKLSKLKV